MTNKNDLIVFNAALRIGDIIFEYVNKDPDLWLKDVRSGGVNPYRYQTESGLFLEMYYGHPSSLWTPWGEYRIGGSGSGSWEKHMDDLLTRLGATEEIPGTKTSLGYFGPVYAIHKVDDVNLPKPILRERSDFLDYEVAKQTWESMKAQLEK